MLLLNIGDTEGQTDVAEVVVSDTLAEIYVEAT
jgi:hypothetical protein